MQLSSEIRNTIEQTILDGGICFYDEYCLLAQKICEISPCNLLIFGIGHDHKLWEKCNKNGTTCFLEESQEWIDRTNISDRSIICKIDYGTINESFIDNATEDDLLLSIPKDILSTPWDIIFVDAPPESLGRSRSIYTAYHIAKTANKNVHVYIHDIDRATEKKYSDKYFLNMIDNTYKK
jgi:hypothetical protein